MPLSPAPALLVGIGARIVLDHLTRSGESSTKDFVLVGVWQGVGLHYASKVTSLAVIVGLGISAKLVLEFNIIHDIARAMTTLLGIALGVLCTECLSQFFDSPEAYLDPGRPRKKSLVPSNSHIVRKERQVQFAKKDEEEGTIRKIYKETVHPISDITSVDSSSEMIGPSKSMSPLEREIATLRTRASLADSERRRFKEEKKWAVSQGNLARASQMKWQVKRFTALMQSFHREADAKLLEVDRVRKATTSLRHFPSNTRPNIIEGRQTDSRVHYPLEALKALGQDDYPGQSLTRQNGKAARVPLRSTAYKGHLNMPGTSPLMIHLQNMSSATHWLKAFQDAKIFQHIHQLSHGYVSEVEDMIVQRGFALG